MSMFITAQNRAVGVLAGQQASDSGENSEIMFQIAIAIAAVSALAKKRCLWLVC
jgi:hypothetical protein